MRPAQIRVFDGLRLTTDHVNHLQGAFASGFEDFREILGLGRAQTGLAVSIDGGAATIQPGVAFDQQKNRLACDAPLKLNVNFGPQDTEKFICLKYEQVEDNPVEGHPTMIWDSCSALVRDALPAEKDNLVTLARIVRSPDGTLRLRPPVEPPCLPSEAKIVVEVPVGPATPDAGTINVAGSSPQTPPTLQQSEAQPTAPAAVPPSSAKPASEAAGTLHFRQGVMQLVSEAVSASYFRSVLAPALRQKMGADPIDLSFSLAQAEIVPDIAVATFSTHCLLSGELTLLAAQEAAQAGYRFECVGNGEVLPGAGGLQQFAACTLLMNPVPAQTNGLWGGSDLTAQGVAQFSFGQWSTAPEEARPPYPADILGGLALVVQLVPAAAAFQLTVKLLWSGQVSEESLQALETQDIALAWRVLFGWKAIGN
jgi:hypothetical protein